MSTLGSADHPRDESRRKEWQAPALSVLVFRATAAGVTSTADSELPGFFASPPPPPAPPPPPLSPPPPPPPSSPPPPPPSKGALQCDGAVQVAAGTGMTSFAAPLPTSKHGGINTDAVFHVESCISTAVQSLT
jgi:hypothetical protein